jgi:hypothetical protein
MSFVMALSREHHGYESRRVHTPSSAPSSMKVSSRTVDRSPSSSALKSGHPTLSSSSIPSPKQNVSASMTTNPHVASRPHNLNWPNSNGGIDGGGIVDTALSRSKAAPEAFRSCSRTGGCHSSSQRTKHIGKRK